MPTRTAATPATFSEFGLLFEFILFKEPNAPRCRLDQTSAIFIPNDVELNFLLDGLAVYLFFGPIV